MKYKILDVHETDDFYKDRKNLIGTVYETNCKLNEKGGRPEGFVGCEDGKFLNPVDKRWNGSNWSKRGYCLYAFKLEPIPEKAVKYRITEISKNDAFHKSQELIGTLVEPEPGGRPLKENKNDPGGYLEGQLVFLEESSKRIGQSGYFLGVKLEEVVEEPPDCIRDDVPGPVSDYELLDKFYRQLFAIRDRESGVAP